MPQHVYQAIAAITAALSKEGISKSRKNQQQGYSFRGIDEVYSALSGLLAEHQLCIIPRCAERIITERESKSGGALYGVTVAVEFDLVSAKDGSSHTARMYGEAMDSADKATNKAMSAAYKYMALEVFCIPTEGDNDADAHTPEPIPTPREVQKVRDGQLCLPGTPKTFDGHGGQPLNEVPSDVLTKAGNWLAKKDAKKNASLISAITEVLESRRESLDQKPAALLDEAADDLPF